jgi:hypothetical protein
MSPGHASIPYPDLAAIADHLFDACEDDVRCLSRRIEALESDTRNELLVSDLLNSWQVFYYYFRTTPDELTREKLELEPASSLIRGITLDEIELMELIFMVKNQKPFIVISDGTHQLATYEGNTAYAEGLRFIENPPY